MKRILIGLGCLCLSPLVLLAGMLALVVGVLLVIFYAFTCSRIAPDGYVEIVPRHNLYP